MVRSSLSPFFVDDREGRTSLFSHEAFTDASGIHEYFSTQKEEDEYEGKYEALNAIVDCYADLRAIAEKREKESDNCHVVNQSKAMPLFFDDVYRFFLEKREIDEPPLRFITKIAIEHFNIINILVHNLHKVLRRDRAFLPVDRVQQIDVQCLRWLSRQPGRTNYERAGDRQKILAVVRFESIDTLENRVFKQFLEYCSVSCKGYLHDYQSEYPESERVLAVSRLYGLISYAFSLPEFATISRLHSVPCPNYVLQNNVLYRVVWNLYLQVLARTRLVETLWRNRHRVVKEFAKMLFLVLGDRKANIKLSPFQHRFWILQFASEDGSFFERRDWKYMDYDGESGTSYSFVLQSVSSRFRSIPIGTSCPNDQVLGVAYVPDEAGLSCLSVPKGWLNIVFVEKPLPDFLSSDYSSQVLMDGAIVENTFESLCRICKMGV
ncbi:MAG: DUF2357 domain-containing protein [Sphaerochaeta sp.]|jgi:hypothetical protein